MKTTQKTEAEKNRNVRRAAAAAWAELERIEARIKAGKAEPWEAREVRDAAHYWQGILNADRGW